MRICAVFFAKGARRGKLPPRRIIPRYAAFALRALFRIRRQPIKKSVQEVYDGLLLFFSTQTRGGRTNANTRKSAHKYLP